MEKLNKDYMDDDKLKQYMDNYFASLDIQTEIDNKLDEMADQGQLTQLILEETIKIDITNSRK